MDDSRPLAVLAVALVAIAAYEALFADAVGSTPGKMATSLRITSVGRASLDQIDAWRRGVATAIATVAILSIPTALDLVVSSASGLLVAMLVLGIAATAILSTSTSPIRRGAIDRFAGTVVLHVEAPGVLSAADIESRDGGGTPVVVTRWGPVASLGLRLRARTSRLDDSPALVLGLVAVLLLWSSGLLPLALGATVAWIILWIVDETWRLGRLGGTAGHRREGLAVVDEETGEAPDPPRAAARAVTLAIFSFFPPLVPVLLLWMRMSPAGRGPHDLVAGTVVVTRDPNPDADGR